MSAALKYRYPFPPDPAGWYCLGFSDELKPGQIVARTFMMQEVVLFRTQTGTFAVMDAYCPHMGAHIAKGGTVEGETIRCPFHGFCFDTSGTCTKTGYDTKPPPSAKLRSWPVQEMNGLLLAYYHPNGDAPTWEVPKLDDAEWSPLTYNEYTFRGHPQETTENSVDFGHFAIVHGYSGTEILGPLHVEGPYLSGKYAMCRAADVFMSPGLMVRAEFTVHVWGLGYSLVDVWVETIGLRCRVFVLPAPIDGEQIAMRSAVSVDKNTSPRKVHWALGLMPRKWAMKLIQRGTLKGYCADLLADFEIWENKTYIDPPALAQGDGPVPAYRKYCRQFYPHLETWSAKAHAAITSPPR